MIKMVKGKVPSGFDQKKKEICASRNRKRCIESAVIAAKFLEFCCTQSFEHRQCQVFACRISFCLHEQCEVIRCLVTDTFDPKVGDE